MTEKTNYVFTGASGRLGTQLHSKFPENAEVILLSKQELEPKNVRSVVKKLGKPTYFIHLAWPVRNKDYLDSDENLKMLKLSSEIFSNLSDLPIKIISAGTIFEAGEVKKIEDFVNPNPQNLYAESKVKLHKHLIEILPDSHLWARIGYQVSAYDPPHRLVPFLLESQGGIINLRNGKNNLDLIHVSDVAEAFLQIIKCYDLLPREIVVGAGRAINIESFASCFGSVLETGDLSESTVTSITAPNSLFKLGWKPKYHSQEELHKAIIDEFRKSVVAS